MSSFPVLSPLLLTFLSASPATAQAPLDPCTLLDQVLVPTDPVDAPYGGIGALVGDTLMISSTLGDGSAPDSGTLLEFVRSGGIWSFASQIDSPDGAFQDYFGGAVALEGDTLVVGSLADGGVGYQSGAVYVFQRVAGEWVFSQKLIGSGVGSGDWFGQSVDLEGDRLAIGCLREHTGSRTGTVYLFERSAGVWTEVQKIVPDVFPASEFGTSLDLQGDLLVVGSPQFNFLTDSGDVYVYEHNGAAWSKTGFLKAPDAVPGNGFGSALELEDDLLVVGAPMDAPAGVQAAGSAYVFRRSGQIWLMEAKLTAPALEGDGRFGVDVDLGVHGLWAVIGERGSAPGGAHLFWRNATAWSHQIRLDGAVGLAGVPGASLALDGTTIVQAPPAEVFQGAVQVHSLPPGPTITYCTAKSNSLGCVPAIGSLGVPSASATCPFWITANDVINGQVGILFYGIRGPATVAFGGGVLCVHPPLIRTWPTFSGGHAPPVIDCSGFLTLDFQDWLQSPFAAWHVPGHTISAQYWYRDPGDPAGVGLTDALHFSLWP